jgi:hypothetical protein
MEDDKPPSDTDRACAVIDHSRAPDEQCRVGAAAIGE